LSSTPELETKYLAELHKTKKELLANQQETQHQEELNKMLLKSFETFKLQTQESLLGSQRQVDNLVWSQFILWVFIAIVLVMTILVKSSGTKPTKKTTNFFHGEI